jgi:hypothetical protein
MARAMRGIPGLAGELAARGVSPWPWKPHDRREDLTTAAMEKLFDPVRWPDLAQAAATAFLAASGRASCSPPPTALQAIMPHRSPGPDLLLTGNDDQVLFVVEVKRGAAAQVTGLARFPHDDIGARFTDERSRAMPRDLGQPEWHVVQDDSVCCWAHTGILQGKRQGGLFQIDVYRHWASWLPTTVSLPDPAQVRWILLDEYDRTPRQAFPDAFSADLWEPGSLMTFARLLVPAYDTLPAGEGKDRLEKALRMLAS